MCTSRTPGHGTTLSRLFGPPQSHIHGQNSPGQAPLSERLYNHQPADREEGLGIDATVEPRGGGIGTSLLATNIDHKYLFGL